ncbi:unnamed protein product [Effrenium voratum]|nr:unnamed protein product [Effrenium voratum]
MAGARAATAGARAAMAVVAGARVAAATGARAAAVAVAGATVGAAVGALAATGAGATERLGRPAACAPARTGAGRCCTQLGTTTTSTDLRVPMSTATRCAPCNAGSRAATSSGATRSRN